MIRTTLAAALVLALPWPCLAGGTGLSLPLLGPDVSDIQVHTGPGSGARGDVRVRRTSDNASSPAQVVFTPASGHAAQVARDAVTIVRGPSVMTIAPDLNLDSAIQSLCGPAEFATTAELLTEFEP